MQELFTFTPPEEDPLGVLTSTAPVAEGAAHVRIDPDAAARFARDHRDWEPPAHVEDGLHCTFLPPKRFANYLLVLEALNFCFWDAEPRWRVEHGGRALDGYWALAAALDRAIREDGTPLWDAAFLAGLEAEQAAHLLRGQGRTVPLPEARLAHLREAGAVLLENWRGEFANLIAAAKGNAGALVRLIVEAFPSFRDESVWRGRPVRFYKRAQICAADLARLLPRDSLGRLAGLEHLTAFADYKVPQVLRARGVLVLAPPLAERVEGGVEVPAGSPEEVEIRAATIWACEWIARALARTGRGGGGAAGGTGGAHPPTAADVDALLWGAGQDKRGLPPYHRTRTVFY